MGKLTQLIEIQKTNDNLTKPEYSLREIEINPEFVLRLSTDTQTRLWARLGTVRGSEEKINENQEYTRIVMSNSTSFVVIGSVSEVSKKIQSNKRTVLKG